MCEQGEQLKLVPLYGVLRCLMGHRLTFNLSLVHQAPIAMYDKSRAQVTASPLPGEITESLISGLFSLTSGHVFDLSRILAVVSHSAGNSRGGNAARTL